MAQDQYSGNLACICPGRSNFARKLKVRYTVSEKFQTVSFDLYSSVMGITGLGLVWRAAAKTYDVSALPGEVFLATGLAVFLVLTGIQLLRLVFCRQIILAEWHSRASKNFFCAATISGFLLAMGLLPYSILLAKVLWIAAVAAQIFSSRVHSAAGLSISSIRMKSARYGLYLWWATPLRLSRAWIWGFRASVRCCCFQLCSAGRFLCRLSSGVSCLFVLLPRRRPCPAWLLWFQRLRSSPSDCTVFMAV